MTTSPSTSDEAAVDAELARAPQDIALLLRKGDLREEAGDARAAVSFYNAALRAASARSAALPPTLLIELRRAQALTRRATELFEMHLERGLTAAGYPPGARSARFQASLDILRGRRQVDLSRSLQRPATFFMPGLPQRRFYERGEFAWAPAVEAAAPSMLEELRAVTAMGGEGFRPYLVSDPSRPRADFHGLLDNPSWSTLHLHEKGQPTEHAARCPRSFTAVHALPLCRITTRAPSVLFSRLGPGARIPPHHGVMNARLICHLPLVVPSGCGFRVGGEPREWRVGELLVFDDTVEHEAWNDSAEDRVVLIFDVWRPELTTDERGAVTAMFEAIDGYAGERLR